MLAQAQAFPWAKELERTVTDSLVQCFGLGFLAFNDRDGGHVDTIHNAREGVWKPGAERERYERRGDYKGHKRSYRTSPDYIGTGRTYKNDYQAGTLKDAYTGEVFGPEASIHRDHVVPCHEIHNDPGVYLAGIKPEWIANRPSNLQPTSELLNKTKGGKRSEQFAADLRQTIANRVMARDRTLKEIAELSLIENPTPQHRHALRSRQDQARKQLEGIDALRAADPERIVAVGKRARAAYERTVHFQYYGGAFFWNATLAEAGKSGLRMGARQALGLLMAEIWFELREQLPGVATRIRAAFCLTAFVRELRHLLRRIVARVRARCHDLWAIFTSGVCAGVLASFTTTLTNIFITTLRDSAGRMRALWSQAVKAIKLVAFNPDKLDFIALCQAVTAMLSFGVASVVGATVRAQLAPMLAMPFGTELATFVETLVTGLGTLGLTWWFLYSGPAAHVWAFLAALIPHAGAVLQYRAVNAELDRYLIALGQREFAFNVEEQAAFVRDLQACNDELGISGLLSAQLMASGIVLPFEIENFAMTRQWLRSKVSGETGS